MSLVRPMLGTRDPDRDPVVKKPTADLWTRIWRLWTTPVEHLPDRPMAETLYPEHKTKKELTELDERE